MATTANRRARPPPIVTTAPSDRTFLRQRHHASRDDVSSSESSGGDDADADDERSRPMSALMPRSALANYFNLDFSFLDDEPPPRKTAYGRRTQEEARRVERTARPPRGDEDYFSARRVSGSAPGTPSLSFSPSIQKLERLHADFPALAASKRLSTGSTTGSLPFPSANLPFPSKRPNLPHRASSDSVSTRRSSILSPGFSPSHLPSPDRRRPSAVSYTSVDSAGSVVSASCYASRRSPLSPTFPSIPEAGPDAAEKRKRLAAFLDETASAMEGGKSLMMVVPELVPAGPQHKSLSELAEQQVSPQPASRSDDFRHPFDVAHDYRHGAPQRLPSGADADDDSLSPTSAPPAVLVEPPAHEEQVGERDPDIHSPRATALEAGHSANDQLAADGPGTGEARSLERSFSGLGLSNMDPSGSAVRPQAERSPSTLRAPSPTSPARPSRSSASFEDDERRKRLDKRRKIIRELVETESSYAVDMAVVRDIYLARARGARASLALCRLSVARLSTDSVSLLLSLRRHGADCGSRHEHRPGPRQRQRCAPTVAISEPASRVAASGVHPPSLGSLRRRGCTQDLVGLVRGDQGRPAASACCAFAPGPHARPASHERAGPAHRLCQPRGDRGIRRRLRWRS